MKYFDQDKNYILKQVQKDLTEQLCRRLIQLTIESFQRIENPLGLEDDFIIELKKTKAYNLRFIETSYEKLSVIYRYLNANNQLEFIWDGRSHYEKYIDDWTEAFENWIRNMGYNPSFNRIIIKGAILYSDSNQEFLRQQLQRFISNFFAIKLPAKTKKKVKSRKSA
ncbi:MAG: hypothetical protein OEY56_04885 [Cyclobacteriaceae bacterium]|nr:hypothetical protein [Cyclobacteriaceae bacterium]